MYYYLAILKALESYYDSTADIERLRRRWVEALQGVSLRYKNR